MFSVWWVDTAGDPRQNPDVERPKGDYEVCRRCRKDKAAYEPPKNMYRGAWGY